MKIEATEKNVPYLIAREVLEQRMALKAQNGDVYRLARVLHSIESKVNQRKR